VINLQPPPQHPVKWRCVGTVTTGDGRLVSHTSCEVEAVFWYEARGMGERILGLPRGAVEAERVATNGNGNGKGAKA
jgi:hypothetical protein